MPAQRPDLHELFDALGVVIARWEELDPDDMVFVVKLRTRYAIVAGLIEEAEGQAPPEYVVMVANGEPFPN